MRDFPEYKTFPIRSSDYTWSLTIGVQQERIPAIYMPVVYHISIDDRMWFGVDPTKKLHGWARLIPVSFVRPFGTLLLDII